MTKEENIRRDEEDEALLIYKHCISVATEGKKYMHYKLVFDKFQFPHSTYHQFKPRGFRNIDSRGNVTTSMLWNTEFMLKSEDLIARVSFSKIVEHLLRTNLIVATGKSQFIRKSQSSNTTIEVPEYAIQNSELISRLKIRLSKEDTGRMDT